MRAMDEASHRQHECKGVLRNGHRVAARSIHDHDAVLGSRIEIDVIDAHARASDDPQLGSLGHHRVA